MLIHVKNIYKYINDYIVIYGVIIHYIFIFFTFKSDCLMILTC